MALGKPVRLLVLTLALAGAALAAGSAAFDTSSGADEPGAARAASAASLPVNRDPDDDGTALLGDATAGKLTFTMWCAACHGPGGYGGPLDEIAKSAPAFDESTFRALVREGAGHNPPGPYQSFQIADRAVEDLYAYVASHAPVGEATIAQNGLASTTLARTGQPSLLVGDILSRMKALAGTQGPSSLEVKGNLSLLPLRGQGSTSNAILRIDIAPDGTRRQVLTNAGDEDHEAVISRGDLYLQGPLVKRSNPRPTDAPLKMPADSVEVSMFASPLLDQFANGVLEPLDVIPGEYATLRITRIGTLEHDSRACEVWRTTDPGPPIEITIALTADNDLCHVGLKELSSTGRSLAILVRTFTGGTITPPAPGSWDASALDQSCWSDPAFRLDPMRDASGAFREVPQFAGPPNEILDPLARYTAVVETSMGTFRILLDSATSPIAVNNFVCLATYNFYDGLDFAWADPDWILVGGDPLNTARGGPGYEVEAEPSDGSYPRATVAMSATRASGIGSQFFVVLNDWEMGPRYPIIGKVMSGWDTVLEISRQPAGDAAESPIPTLLEPVEIISIEIVTE